FEISQKITLSQCCLYYRLNTKSALILYDKETQTANVINAIDIANDSKQVYFRFFYINENNQVEIYQGYGNHHFDIQDETYNETINKTGKYKIEKSHTIDVLKDG